MMSARQKQLVEETLPDLLENGYTVEEAVKVMQTHQVPFLSSPLTDEESKLIRELTATTST